MKIQVRIINPRLLDDPKDIEVYLNEQLRDLEDYQIKHITQKGNQYTVFYSKDSKDESDLLYYSRRDKLNRGTFTVDLSDEQYKTFQELAESGKLSNEAKEYVAKRKVDHKHNIHQSDLFDAAVASKGIQFTKTTDLFKSPYTGPLNLSDFAKEQIDNKQITDVIINGKPVNWHIDDKGRIIVKNHWVTLQEKGEAIDDLYD